MFIPKEFEISDNAEALAFVKAYSFGVIVTENGGAPDATHLPFHLHEREGKVYLTAHFARANKQWSGIESKTVLVIFNQPHAYISPKHYDSAQNVPTWNYVAVHVYGTSRIVEDEAEGMKILEQMILQNEPEYMKQWEGLNTSYKTGLYRGIVPIEIEIISIKAVGKLSQNKNLQERQRIVDALSQSDNGTDKELAAYMAHHVLEPNKK